jgi:hypothetical protein
MPPCPPGWPFTQYRGVSSHADVTDAYLVTLAKTHGLRLATLDQILCAKPWARGVAENPLARGPGLPST